MKIEKVFKQILGFLILVIPGIANGLELDYYTYNGFTETVNAFERIALVFNDNEYIYLIFIAVVLGIVFGSLVIGARTLGNFGHGNTLGWILMVFLGVALFKGLVIPKGTVHVYDPVRNAYHPVGDVPDLVILIAGGMNKIERVVVELVDNASAYPYGDSAGGINFQLLLNAMTDYSGGLDDYYLVKSVKRYYGDCSQMALIQSSYNFDLNQLRSGTNNLMTLLAELRSPADFTEVYSAAAKGGITVSCEEAWDSYLQPALNDGSLYDAMLGSVCSKSGFNTTDATQLARCQTLLADQNLSVYNFAADHVHFLRNASLASAIANSLQDENPDIGLRTLTNRAVLTEGIGVAQAANEWLPTIRATVLAIVLGLFPLLVVFLVTPLMGRSVVVMVGLFAWLTLWGVADAVMHRSAMDQAMATVEEIQRHQMGITAMMLTPEAATKALAIFGKARSMGITIATFLSAVLFGFSAYALNQIAGSFQGRVDSAGSEAADRSLTPEGTGRTIGGVTTGVSSAFNLANLGLGRMAMASAFNSGVELSRADQYLANTAVQGMGPAESVHAQGSIDAGAQHGNLLATQMNVAASGGEITSAGALLSAAREVTKLEQAQRFGEARGKVEAIQGAGFGNALDFSHFVSAYQTMMTAGDTRTHAANIDRFQDIHAQRTGEELGNQDAADIYSRMRLASITGDINAFEGDADHAVDFMTMNRSLADHHLAGLVQGARALGTTPEALAEAGGATQAAMQSADASQLVSLPIGTIATGAFANRLMSTQSGAALSEVMQDRGIVEGTHALAQTETLLRDANADQLQNLSAATGMPMERLAMAVQGANRQIAFAGDDVEGLVEAGAVGASASSLVAEGGVAALSVSPDGQRLTTSRVAAGSSVAVDDSAAVAAGFGAGGPNSAAILLTDPASEERLEDVLRATEGNPVARDALKMDLAQYLGSITASDVQLRQSATGEVYGGWEVPGVARLVSGASAGIRGSAAGTIADSDAHNVNYGIVNQVFGNSYAAAKRDIANEAIARRERSEPFSVEERENILFDRFAHHLNAEMGQLIGNQKTDHERAMLAAENMEEIPASVDREKGVPSILDDPNSLKAL